MFHGPIISFYFPLGFIRGAECACSQEKEEREMELACFLSVVSLIPKAKELDTAVHFLPWTFLTCKHSSFTWNPRSLVVCRPPPAYKFSLVSTQWWLSVPEMVELHSLAMFKYQEILHKTLELQVLLKTGMIWKLCLTFSPGHHWAGSWQRLAGCFRPCTSPHSLSSQLARHLARCIHIICLGLGLFEFAPHSLPILALLQSTRLLNRLFWLCYFNLIPWNYIENCLCFRYVIVVN